MSTITGTTGAVAESYVRAWLSGDVDKAMSFVATDVVCDAPTGRIKGADAYRRFLEPFVGNLSNGQLDDLLTRDDRAVTVYSVDMPYLAGQRGVEYLTVTDDKISKVLSIFDLAPALKARGEAAS